MEQTSRPAEPPRGTFQARLDERGRLKLPAAIAQYLGRLGEEKVFITSLDLRTARMYPISVWKENEAFFDREAEHSEAAEDVALIANDVGGDSQIDNQERVLFPAELRRELNLEEEPDLWLLYYKGAFEVYGKKVYEERRRRATDNLPEKVRSLKQKGLR